jgi:hypothetical protein
MVERMSDKLDKIVNLQNRTALSLSLGLACSIPLAAPAMAQPDADRQALREQRLLDRAERREVRLENLAQRGGANFNLNSGRAVFSAGNLGNFNNLTINVGGRDKVIDLDSKLTAAELVAAQQVLNGGSQSIVIGRNGAADGGTISLNTGVLTGLEQSVGGNISSMTVARGVQVVDNNSGIDLSGTLRNFGTISAANSVSGSTNTISADTIINGRGGAIESYSGSDLYAADVALNAATSLTNNGSISSAGNLTITAPVISNVRDGSANPTMTAGLNVNLNTANLINDGLISASAGNVNLTNAAGLVAGGTGTLQAGGDINFNTTNSDITVSGGNLLSQNVNFNSGVDGEVRATFGEATGIVNAEGCVIHLYADTDNLQLGTITAYGDPIFTNTGSITITNAIAATNGAPLAIIAGGNIVSGAGNVGLDTSSAAGDGGDLSLIAGATFKTDKKTGNIVVSKKSKTGGLIDLTGGNGGSAPIASITTDSATGEAGDIQMVAFAAKTVGSGSVILPTGVTVSALGATGDGSVTIIGSTKEGTAVDAGNIDAGSVTIGAGTPGAPKGGVAFDPVTGALLSAPFSIKSATTGIVNINGDVFASGDMNVTTGGALNVVGTLNARSESENMNITAGTLNVAAGGEINSDDNEIVTIKTSDAFTLDGTISVGTLNLTADSLLISSTGAMLDKLDNVTTKGAIQVDGQLGRQPGVFDPTRATTTLNVTAGGAFTVGVSGNVSADGAITGATFQNDGNSVGNLAYTATSKKAGGFVNNGTIDGLNVTVNSAFIENASGAQLQATLQTLPTDIPTLTLNTTSINNQGQIGAVGVAKTSPGVLSINSTKGLTIAGSDGSFFTDFNSTVSLTAAGDIVIGGNDGVTNSNPFSLIEGNPGLGVFNVETTGTFKSTLSNIEVHSDGDGNYGTINFLAKGIEYNGLGAAPVFNLSAFGDPNADSKTPVSIEITGNQGLTFGSAPGNFNVVVTGFNATNTNQFITPTNLNVDMANLVLNGTGLILEGTKNLLITGNVVGGETVTITTANKKAFLIGDATTSGQTGIVAGEGISATKNLTINAPGKITINSGFDLTGGEQVTLNAPGLIVNNGGDINPLGGGKVILNTGASSKAEYSNFNTNGLLSASELQINATGTLTLSSGSNQVQTYLSIGENADVADGVGGGGTFLITAGSLKFSSKGIFFDASSSTAGFDNGGTVEITLSTTKTVKVGLGNGEIRADVSADNQSSAEGAGRFILSSVGAVQATDVLTGAINFGDGGAFGLISGTSTVTASEVSNKSYNLFQLTSNSSTALLLSNAGKNGVKDDTSVFGIIGGNLVYENGVGAVVTNGAIVAGVTVNLSAATDVDARDVANNVIVGLEVLGDGGAVNITAARLLIDSTNAAQTGLTIIAEGGTTSGAQVNVTTTDTSSAGNITIDAPNTRGALAIDVSTAAGIGAEVNVTAGNALKVSGNGFNFGSAVSNLGASLTLTSGQATTTGYKGGALTFNDADSAGLGGLAFGTVTLNSGSSSAFLMSGANVNSGNGLSNGNLTAGKIVVNPRAGLGIIDTTGYSATTNSLELNATTINFDDQTISVVSDGAVGSGNITGDGGSISINASDIRFSNQGGVLLQAQANPGIVDSVGGSIEVNDSSTRTLTLGADGFTFDVSNAGVGVNQKGGSVEVNKTNNDLIVDATAFTYGANDGGNLELTSGNSMLISNVAALNGFFLDKITLETAGSDGPFQFGSATDNGFVDVNPTLTAKEIEINTSGTNAGIDTSTGTVLANILTLTTTGNINFQSGGVISVLTNPVNNNGGSIYITAAAFTQSGGNAGYTLDASGAVGGAGGLVDVTLTGTGAVNVDTSNLNVDVANGSAGEGGGVFQLSANGNINLDFAAVDFGANFGGQGPQVSVISNGVLSVANASLISNIGLGGGQFTNAGVIGNTLAGNFQTITISNAALPGGMLEITYLNLGTDTPVSIADAFANLINSNTELQNLGVSAIVDGAQLTLRSTTAGTTYSVAYNLNPEFIDPDTGLPIVQIDLSTFTTGLTLGSKSSQAFVLGGAAVGANGIQDNGLVLDIAAINIINTGLIQTATVGGPAKVGVTDSITVTDARLANGFVTVSYTYVDGDSRDTMAANLAAAINQSVELQTIGVSASVESDVISLSAPGSSTSFSAEAGKTSKITLATAAEGGDIEQGTLVSLGGASTTGPVVLNASGNVGTATEAIQLANGAGSLVISAGLDANVEVGATVGNITVNVGDVADILMTAGDVTSVTGTAGTLNFNYQSAVVNNTATTGLGAFQTTNGDLNFISNAQNVTVSGSVGSTNGNITINNVGTAAGSNIDIAASTRILGSGAVTAQNQGNVYIVIGPVPPAFTPVDGVAPVGVTITETAGGEVTFGAQGSNPAGSITADATATFEALGRDLVFNTGTFGAGAITVGADAVITADPPSAGGSSVAQILSNIAAANGRTTSYGAPAGGSTTTQSSAGTVSKGTGLGSYELTSTVSNPMTVGSANSAESTTATNVLNAFSTISSNAAPLAGLGNGLSGIQFTTTSSATSRDMLGSVLGIAAACSHEQGLTVDSVKRSNANLLLGEVSNVERRSLNRGPLLVSPVKDMVVDTPHGSVSVAAKSLSLLIVNENGVAIYNLHDHHKHAVKIHRSGHAIAIAPGTSAMIYGSNSGAFEEVNPAEFIRYRGLQTSMLKDAKLYRAEFDVVSLLGALPAFKEMMQSESEETRKDMKNVLKTAAILMQLSASGQPFKFYAKPQVTAMSK